MNPDENDENKNDRNPEDPFKKMIEEMMNDIDKMMKKNFQGKPFKDMEATPNTDITFSFSFEPGSPGKGPREGKPKKHPEDNTDIIEKEDEIIVVLETPAGRRKDLKTELKNGKVVIRAPGMMKEIPIPDKSEEIKEKTYSNGVLEIKISKEDQDENL